jgi:hypothetical protein
MVSWRSRPPCHQLGSIQFAIAICTQQWEIRPSHCCCLHLTVYWRLTYDLSHPRALPSRTSYNVGVAFTNISNTRMHLILASFLRWNRRISYVYTRARFLRNQHRPHNDGAASSSTVLFLSLFPLINNESYTPTTHGPWQGQDYTH